MLGQYLPKFPTLILTWASLFLPESFLPTFFVIPDPFLCHAMPPRLFKVSSILIPVLLIGFRQIMIQSYLVAIGNPFGWKRHSVRKPFSKKKYLCQENNKQRSKTRNFLISEKN
jgi:hypothetical protein